MEGVRSFTQLVSGVALVLGCHGAAVLGSAQPSDALAFEVASVKPNDSGGQGMTFRVSPGGRFEALNHSLDWLISRAYELDVQQIMGGPDWIDDDRFDVVAIFDSSTAADADDSRVRRMLQRLLEERFALQLRAEQRALPYYALVFAREDGAFGNGARPSTTDCAAYRRQLQRLLSDGPLSSPPPGPHCGMRGQFKNGSMEFHLGAETLSGLAQTLQRMVGRPVKNETGRSGRFDFIFTFLPDRSVFPFGPGSPLPGIPSVFEAIQEQLGLKLEDRDGPVEVLVVSHAERPTRD